MTTQGYRIARNRSAKEFFTSSSAYDRPRWMPITESTVYATGDLAEMALKKLLKHGAYEARLVPVTEAIRMELEPADPNDPAAAQLPPQDAVSAELPLGDLPPEELPPEDEGMVASNQDQPCDMCDHCPCTCDHDSDGVDDMVDAKLNDSDAVILKVEGVIRDYTGKPLRGLKKEIAQRRRAEEARFDPSKDFEIKDDYIGVAKKLPKDKPVKESETAPTAELIKYDDPATVQQKSDLTQVTAEPEDAKAPANKARSAALSALSGVIAKFDKEAADEGVGHEQRTFAMTAAAAYKELKDLLDAGTPESMKRAQIFMTSWMSPLTNNLPDDTKKYVYYSGRQPTLKNLFDEKKAAPKAEKKDVKESESFPMDWNVDSKIIHAARTMGVPLNRTLRDRVYRHLSVGVSSLSEEDFNYLLGKADDQEKAALNIAQMIALG